MFKKKPYAALEKRLDYHFRNIELLRQALTHPSFRYEQETVHGDNQRLEFLGDAVLGLLAADYLYHHRSMDDEGALTQLRSHVTSGRALAEVGQTIDLGSHLLLGKGESGSGGAERQTNLADGVEAIVGAAWIDGGIVAAKRIFDAVIVPRIEACEQNTAKPSNPKGELQEWCQAKWKEKPEYRIISEEGPAHAIQYRAEVCLPDGRRWEGESSGKQAAEAEAALQALANLEAELKDERRK